jgi:Dynamin family
MTQNSSAESVLETFGRLKGDLVKIVGDAQTIARPLGVLGAQVEPLLQQTLAAFDRDKLNLVVIGGEGQGKSTLINVLLGGGETILPERRRRAATVAPTFVEWGEGAPTYEIERANNSNDGLEVIPCPSVADFEKYMLQEHNPHNQAGVVYGRVRINRPLLKHGLRLVDTPGAEGVSKSITTTAREFIQQSNAVIGVTKGRPGFGPLGRLLGHLGLEVDEGQPARIQALVNNRHYWV